MEGRAQRLVTLLAPPKSHAEDYTKSAKMAPRLQLSPLAPCLERAAINRKAQSLQGTL